MTRRTADAAARRAADRGRSPGRGRSARLGAIAGAASALAFAAIHHLLISDIWFSLIAMMVAGAACGLVVAWSYALLVAAPSMSSWLRYNATYVALFLLLGAASVIAFEPETTIAALVEANEPPGELIAQALPLTALFTFVAAGLVTWIFGGGWRQLGPVLLSWAVLMLLLGLNVSVIGLVEVPRRSAYLIAELYGLIVLLDVAYVGVFVFLERRWLPGF